MRALWARVTTRHAGYVARRYVAGRVRSGRRWVRGAHRSGARTVGEVRREIRETAERMLRQGTDSYASLAWAMEVSRSDQSAA